jgi:hypothetical protein
VSYGSKGYKVHNQQRQTYSDAAAEVQHHYRIKPSIDAAATRNIYITQTMKNGIQMALKLSYRHGETSKTTVQ